MDIYGKISKMKLFISVFFEDSMSMNMWIDINHCRISPMNAQMMMTWWRFESTNKYKII